MPGIDSHGLRREAPRGPLALAVLSSLSTSPRRGYEILRYVGDEAVIPAQSKSAVVESVYPLLRRFLAQGLVKIDAKRSARTGALYSITPKGSETLSSIAEDDKSPAERRLRALRALEPASLTGRYRFATPKERFEGATAAFSSLRYARTLPGGDSGLLEYTLSIEQGMPRVDGSTDQVAGSARPVQREWDAAW
jgi:DNA-binding PadR family transcriptional regulator